MEKKRIILEFLGTMSEVVGKELSENLIKLYISVLEKYSEDELKKAFTTIILSWKFHFMPNPAEIIECIEGNPDDQVGYAWAQLREACGHIGAYESVMFEDLGIQAVVEAWGGWPAVCRLPEDEWKFKYKQFRDIYRQGRKHPPEQRRLAGIQEAHNREIGFIEGVPEPKLIKAPRVKAPKLIH